MWLIIIYARCKHEDSSLVFFSDMEIEEGCEKSRSKFLSQMLLIANEITNIRQCGKASVYEVKNSSP